MPKQKRNRKPSDAVTKQFNQTPAINRTRVLQRDLDHFTFALDHFDKDPHLKQLLIKSDTCHDDRGQGKNRGTIKARFQRLLNRQALHHLSGLIEEPEGYNPLATVSPDERNEMRMLILDYLTAHSPEGVQLLHDFTRNSRDDLATHLDGLLLRYFLIDPNDPNFEDKYIQWLTLWHIALETKPD